MRRSLLLACAPLVVFAAGAVDPVVALPTPAKPQVVIADDHGPLTEIAPGIAIGKQIVMLNGRTLFDQGPADGLEVLACLDGGKQHESFLKLETRNGTMVNFACISVLGLRDGRPVPREGSGVPARGTPVRLTVEWRDPDHPDTWLAAEASSCVRDRLSDRAQPPLPYIYTGSRRLAIPETGADGKPVQAERFMLDITKSVAVNFDEPDALFASPFPGAAVDDRWEVSTSLPTPPVQTPARLVLRPAALPLTVQSTADGTLSRDGGVLDDVALANALAAAYGPAAQPTLFAVGVLVTDDVPRETDLTVRERILAAARAAGVWVVPVFVIP